ncbi:hypothetical protein SDRG_10997 [Saprolegnia diclina VS20]|uniref:Uncharacterized protein n=1 Tax=Saprolegnia diclina (strain VS20) TaxID=1156394 RepID=T0Q9T6_SAPDV|nr:hypothetical protein SDRG_10997 [Saprolegnia diclina VS20]EQC31396.1 hypothetical protein SDRG_10997 [Saprolegnia diclina VS20]|eukprot:XP_008615237.1 hypothetical protein SDRG_10997 [Saprolegnia diclina VS20]
MAGRALHKSIAKVQQAKVFSAIAPGTKYIGTHNGTFHCDEALAVSMLKILPRFEAHDILRTRDMAKLAGCDAVVDVGGEYNPDAIRFDHHQKTFTGTMDGEPTKLSSAGLVYKHFGRDIIQTICDGTLSDKVLDIMYHKMYKGFIEHIDGIDNGVEVATGTQNYSITTSLSSRVGYLNARWNEPQTDDVVNARFHDAMLLTISEFVERVRYYYEAWLPARTIVETALAGRFTVHKSGEILTLPYCPWKAHLYAIEDELLISGQIKFVLYEDSLGGMWRIQAVNVEDGKFALRMGLPAAWRGFRDDELSTIAGIPGCTFVHAGGFIGGNKTYEGALAMAVYTIEHAEA